MRTVTRLVPPGSAADDLFEYQANSLGGWAMADMAGCGV
jgi:hypothetical protein